MAMVMTMVVAVIVVVIVEIMMNTTTTTTTTTRKIIFMNATFVVMNIHQLINAECLIKMYVTAPRIKLQQLQGR